MSKSTPRATTGKQTAKAKPWPEYPLTAHPSNRWCKRVRGVLYYFGPIEDRSGERSKHELALAALEKWNAEKEYLITGRTPPANIEGVTVRDVCDGFLQFKAARVESGEITQRTFGEYRATTDAIIRTFGKPRLASDLTADDFGRLRVYLAQGHGLVSLGNLIQRVKVCFKWAFESGLLERPPRYGQQFAMPSRAALRKERAAKVAKHGRRDFTADEVRKLLGACKGAAGVRMKAFMLLAVNCGLGSADIAAMTPVHLDLKGGWLNYPRRKTGIERRCRLWPETIEAIQAAMANHPKHIEEQAAGLAFVTKYGRSWNRWPADPIAQQFAKLCKAVGVQGGRGFYSLRRTLATAADGARDPVARRHILGHAAPSSDMGDVYVQSIDDVRLLAVAEHVRAWLWPPQEKAKVTKPAKGKSKSTKSSKNTKSTKATSDKPSRPLRIVG